jgi:hypothetical protein
MTVQVSRPKSTHKKTKRQYDNKIDIIIYDLLTKTESLGSNEMKSKIEESLGRKISFDTYSIHAKRMVKEKDLLRHDTGERGKKSVSFSLTEGAKQRRDLKILRVHPEYKSLEKIYANLFLRGILSGETYGDSDLDNILKEIHASRNELVINRIQTAKVKNCDTFNLMKFHARRIPTNLITTYKDTASGVEIVETTFYHENILYGNRKEEDLTSYEYTVPGISIDEFTNKFYSYKPDVSYCQQAFQLLLSSGIIRPVMEFRGKTRYAITDSLLTHFLLTLQSLHKTRKRFSHLQWSYLRGPTTDERRSREIYYSDQVSCDKAFNRDEIDRYDVRRTAARNELLQLKAQGKQNMKLLDKLSTELVKYLEKNYAGTINKYPFLQTIIRLATMEDKQSDFHAAE